MKIHEWKRNEINRLLMEKFNLGKTEKLEEEEELDEGPVWDWAGEQVDAVRDWKDQKVDEVQAGARAAVKKRLSAWIASNATTVAETVVPGVWWEKKIEESFAETMVSNSDDIAECIVSMVPLLNE